MIAPRGDGEGKPRRLRSEEFSPICSMSLAGGDSARWAERERMGATSWATALAVVNGAICSDVTGSGSGEDCS
jgi:hypothetical protein